MSADPSTHEAEAGGSQVQEQPGLYSKTLSQKKNGKDPGKIHSLMSLNVGRE
jgi:hypothetical protein